ncbi:hypothetical protein GF389_05395 [Candidatus Dojkabacteria bacterium]|nr:hypothetical protein [Candidatus Dojkabacteria bacterium]
MSEIAAFFDRAAQRTGFQREFYIENNLPTLSSNVVVVPMFGDFRTTFIMSSLLLHRFKKNLWNSKYLVVASWPGWRGLFPYAEEYWSPQDASLVHSLASHAHNFNNTSQAAPEISRGFLEAFANIRTFKDFKPYYDGVNFGSRFWEEFKEVRRYLPEISASNQIPSDVRTQIDRLEGKKIFLFPNRKMRSWQRGKLEILDVPREFWVHFIERLLGEGYSPVIYQNPFSFDISTTFADRCVYLAASQMSDVLSVMKYIGCTFDFFSGLSRLSISARTPFVVVDERERFVRQKEYEIDDLCCKDLPKRYIFSFSALLLTGSPKEWDISFLNTVVANLNRFVDNIDPNMDWLPSRELDEVISYEGVRQYKSDRLGLKFISLSKKKKEQECKNG